MTALRAAPAVAAEPAVDPPRRSRTRVVVLFVVLAVALLGCAVLAAGSGQLSIPAEEVVSSVLHRLGLGGAQVASHANGEAALWTIRFPRVAMALLVGAALATAGALMQGVFGNPLAEPGVAGVSSGAALAACAAIALGWTFLGPWTTSAVAFAGGLAATLVVYLLSRSGGRTEVVTLILTGVAINAIAGAGIAFLTFVGDTQAREQIVFWQLGSLNGTRWPYVALVAPLVVVGIVLACTFARRLDLLALGERPARHLGVDVERLRVAVIVVVALLTAGAVAFSGIIAFVGLVVPHLARILVGALHRNVLPVAAVGGALFMLWVDVAARVIVRPQEIPLSVVTGLVGAPIFLFLLGRRHYSYSGGGE